MKKFRKIAISFLCMSCILFFTSILLVGCGKEEDTETTPPSLPINNSNSSNDDNSNSEANNDSDSEKDNDSDSKKDNDSDSEKDDPLLGTPLTFEAMTAGAQITFEIATGITGKVEYCVDGTTWNTYTPNATVTLPNIGDKVMFRGDNDGYYNISTKKRSIFSCTQDCYIYGNIMSLLSSTDFATKKELKAESTFNGLFRDNVHIKNHPNKSLLLPATTLANSCYWYLFYGCIGLTTAPELPAMNLAERCYEMMFQNCSVLTKAPNLPATTLASYCYCDMFRNCTNLESAPFLPATIMADKCYSGMFQGCTKLTQAPELPATTLSVKCYSDMFRNCTSLKNAPELPATTLADYCYWNTFTGCAKLTQAPELPATTLAKNCYDHMFSECTALTSVPSILPATILEEACYRNMFQGCTRLTQTPELPATTLVKWCYVEMFQGCTKLKNVKCLAKNISALDCTLDWLDGVASSGTFKTYSTTKWKTGASGIPSNWTREYY